MTEKRFNILLGCTGSVATIKVPNIIQGLRDKLEDKANIHLITTKNAKFFLPEDLQQVIVYNFNYFLSIRSLSFLILLSC